MIKYPIFTVSGCQARKCRRKTLSTNWTHVAHHLTSFYVETELLN